MKEQNSNLEEASILRQKAEERLKLKETVKRLSMNEKDGLKLIHELEVHQIELEMQNEELVIANQKTEIAKTKYTELYDFAPIGYLTLNKIGEINKVNFVAAHMLNKERSDLINKSLVIFLSENSQADYNNFLKNIFTSRLTQTIEVAILIKDKPPRFVIINGIATPSGIECLLTMIDITERKKDEEKLEIVYNKLITASERQNAILNALPTSIALINGNGEIIAVNDSWKQFGIENNLNNPNHCIGDNYIDISNNSKGEEEETGKKIANGIKQVINGVLRSYRLEYPCDSANIKRWFIADVTPLSKEQSSGAVIMHTNITEKKEFEIERENLKLHLEKLVQVRTEELSKKNMELDNAVKVFVGRELKIRTLEQRIKELETKK